MIQIKKQKIHKTSNHKNVNNEIYYISMLLIGYGLMIVVKQTDPKTRETSLKYENAVLKCLITLGLQIE